MQQPTAEYIPIKKPKPYVLLSTKLHNWLQTHKPIFKNEKKHAQKISHAPLFHTWTAPAKSKPKTTKY